MERQHVQGEAKDLEAELYEPGIPMKDLSEVEVLQFPGLKQEHWWSVGSLPHCLS